MILNIAAYRFVALTDVPALRARLRAACESLALKGTILLAPEGINLFLAGDEKNLRAFVQHQLRDDPRFAPIEIKESWSEAIPFRRLKIKLKKEIVTFRQPQINPALAPAPNVTATQFKQWLDEGRDLVILDTRNRVEFDAGAFDGSVQLGNDNFTDFAKAVDEKLAEWKDKTIVSFCTGGIRCEKAAPYMQAKGFQHVFQLQGGILKYFEEIGHAHYHGDCFVFDERAAVDGDLKPLMHSKTE
jgi:UPF0176 protein